MQGRGLTLLELLVVIIIVGVLATLGIMHYRGIREQTIDREAQANLLLIQAGQKIYRMEQGSYYTTATNNPCDGGVVDPTARINACLKLSLPTGANRNWTYSAPLSNGCGQAGRTLSVRYWHICPNDEAASTGDCAGACP